MENGEVNILQILKLATETPALHHLHISLLVDVDSESYCLGLAFELGLFSWHAKSYVKETLVDEFENLFERLKLTNWNSSLLAAEYLRLYLKEEGHVRSLLSLEENLLALFPSYSRVLLALAEAEFLNGRKERATTTLNQAELIDDKIVPFCTKLRQEFGVPSEKEEASKGKSGAQVNILNLKNVVIIDPDTDVLYHCEQMLRAVGVKNIHAFEDGKTAHQWMVSDKEPDLVLMEWKIPQLNGPILVQRLRQAKYFQVPIVVMSSLIRRDELLVLKEMGVDELIEKPFDAATFYKTIVGAIQQNRTPAEHKATERKIYRLLRAKKLQEAESFIRPFLSDESVQELAKLRVEAEYLFAKDNFAKARDVGVRALSIKSDSLAMLNLVGKALLKLNNFEQALKCFEKANELSSMNIERLINIGEINMRLENFDKAQEAINEAVKLDAENPEVREAQAKLQVELGNTSEAEAIMEELESGETIAAYMNNRAISLARSGRFGDSVELYSKAISSFPKRWKDLHAVLNYNLALAFLRSENFEKGIHHLKIVVDQKAAVLGKKAESLVKRVEQCMKSGKKFQLHGSNLETSLGEHPKLGQGNLLDLVMKPEAKRGQMCCYLIFRAVDDHDPKAKDLVKNPLPSFSPRRGTKTLTSA